MMTALGTAAAVLTVFVVAGICWPLLRRQPTHEAAGRFAYDLTVLAAQLAEVERDAARGLIAADEAAAAEREIKRRMLAAAEDGAAAAATASPAGGRGLAITLALLVPFLAGGLYLWLGQPLQPDRPLAERRATGDLAALSATASPAAQADLAQAVTQLESYLAGHPGALDGWLLLGRSYQTLDRYRDAERAFGEAYRLAPDRADVAGAYAEAMVVANQGQVTDAALAVLQRAIAGDPLNVQARYFLSLGLGQRGQVREAAQGLADLIALSPADAPWRAQVQRQLEHAAAELKVDPASITVSPDAAKLAAQLRARPADQPGSGGATTAIPGPSPEDMAAAAQMTAEERRQMVRGMVERLAARLNDNPDDRDGWLRLARAYEVLGEPEKAADARARAEEATRP